VVRRKGFWV